jgi:hypothetical protein
MIICGIRSVRASAGRSRLVVVNALATSDADLACHPIVTKCANTLRFMDEFEAPHGLFQTLYLFVRCPRF